MKSVLFCLLLIVILISSCGISVQKRLYRNGFYVNTKSTLQTLPDHTPLVESAVDSSFITEQSTVIVRVADALMATSFIGECAADTAAAIARHSPPQKTLYEDTVPRPGTSPAPKSVEEEIKTIRKLDLATKITLLGWLTIILGIVAIPGAFVLSIITLRRIRTLKRNHALTEAQTKDVEKIRRHARAVLWISSILLLLTLISLMVLLFVPSSIGINGPLLVM